MYVTVIMGLTCLLVINTHKDYDANILAVSPVTEPFIPDC